MKNQKKITDQKLNGSSLNPKVLKVSLLAVAIAVSTGVTFPSFAETVSIKDVDPATITAQSANGSGSGQSATSIETQIQATTDDAANCADPANVNGLAHAQQKTLNDMKAMILTPINTDNMFSTASKGGCFNALKDFPNLSASIPSLTGIANALKDTLIKYATRKVCAAVNDALEEVIGPVNEIMEELSSSGQIDLTGEFNKKMVEELYKIDPELGRVSTGVSDEIKWDLGDEWDKAPGIVPTNPQPPENPTETQPPPNAQPSGSFMTQTGEMDGGQQETSSDGSLTDSAKDFLRSIF